PPATAAASSRHSSTMAGSIGSGRMRWDITTQLGHDLLQVLPDLPLGRGGAKEVGGMVGGHHLDALVGVPAAPERADRNVPLAGQPLRRELAERDDDAGPNGGELLLEEGLTGLDLVGLGVAVAGRATL